MLHFINLNQKQKINIKDKLSLKYIAKRKEYLGTNGQNGTSSIGQREYSSYE